MTRTGEPDRRPAAGMGSTGMEHAAGAPATVRRQAGRQEAEAVRLSDRQRERRHRAYAEYCALAVIAQQTQCFADAEAAGGAWRDFLDHYLSPRQRAALSEAASVVAGPWLERAACPGGGPASIRPE